MHNIHILITPSEIGRQIGLKHQILYGVFHLPEQSRIFKYYLIFSFGDKDGLVNVIGGVDFKGLPFAILPRNFGESGLPK
jgi:hypothetical protein